MSIAPTAVDTLVEFVQSLTTHYGAAEIPNGAGHKQYTNPWAEQGGEPLYVFVMKQSRQVRFGRTATSAQKMSDRMIAAVAARRLTKSGMVSP